MYSYDLKDEECAVDLRDFDERPKSTHKDAGDALYSLMEQLYNSANSIDKECIKNDFLCLCEKLGVKNEFIQDAEDLRVMHTSSCYQLECRIKEEYTKKMQVIKESAIELRTQLCAEHEEVDLEKTTHALSQICEKVGSPLYWGQRATIARETWHLIGRSELLKLVHNLINRQEGKS